jgi:16S rRNA (uracil1498-N3)-methyltransferase
VQFLYHKSAGLSIIELRGEEHRYIFRVRRHKEGETISLRNLIDNKIYNYKISILNRKMTTLIFQDSQELIVEAKKRLHIGWCIIEPKSIERSLPTLNEMGVDSISFIYCKRSQQSYKLDFKRLEKILLNSSQQCGRSSIMKLELIENLERFLEIYPNAKMLNFSKNRVSNSIDTIDSIVIGCEGGFTSDEESLFSNIVGFDTPLILKSRSAICAIASKILL